MMNKPFQRKGAESNTQVGRDFESNTCAFLSTQGMQLRPGLAVEIGINGHKPHKFDLGDPEKKVIVECKAHTWTEGGNVPSAKMTAWNQAMFFFYAAPVSYRKILFVLLSNGTKLRFQSHDSPYEDFVFFGGEWVI